MVFIILFAILVVCCPFNTVGQQQAWSNVVGSACRFTVNHDLDIQFEKNPLLFIDRLTEPDVNSCRKQCCEHTTCNSYVWDNNAFDRVNGNVNGNCKLLKCSDEGTDCKNALARRTNVLGDRSEHEVGFITGVTDNTTPNPLDAVLGIADKPSPAATTKPKTYPPVVTPSTQTKQDSHVAGTPTPQKSFTTSKTTTTVPLIKDVQQPPATPITTTNMKSVSITKTTTIKTTIKPTTSTTTSFMSTPVPTVMASSHNNQSRTDSPSSTSKMKHIHTKAPKNVTNSSTNGVIEQPARGIAHSDNLALTGAVFFGLAFSFVTIYLVGKRWLEGLRESKGRHGYTRISYLLNGV